MIIRDLVRKHEKLKMALVRLYSLLRDFNRYIETKKNLEEAKNENKRIFYFGKPAHANLGDLAQGVCLREWLDKTYPDRKVVEVETNAVVNTSFSLMNYIKKLFKNDDFIVFQSGYSTTDLGGYADAMHRAVMNALPDAKMLMFPQTIYFKKQKNKQLTAQCYNSIKNLLFLARDSVSYQSALEMFPDIHVMQYPDIVTTLIGRYRFDFRRDGILFCLRDDSEKFYTDDEISTLYQKCLAFCNVNRTDTTKKQKITDVVNNARALIRDEITNYAHYKIIITDRYHGTIFSLAAGTPVIVLKTTDHKVTTGADWFKGVCNEYVHVAASLDEAYEIAQALYNQPLTHELKPYFEIQYYDKLSEIFENFNR